MAVHSWRGVWISTALVERIRPVYRIMIVIVSFLMIGLLRFSVASQVERNSDDANNFLAGLDMARGNLNLHGWVLAPDNYVPTDVLGAAVLSLIFGPRPVLMQVAEALIWAGIIMVAITLAMRGLRARPALIAAMVPLTLLALTVQRDNTAMVFLTNVASHGFTILLALFGFWLVVSITEETTKPVWPRLLMLGIVIATGSFADPIFLVIGCGPVIVSCFLRLQGHGNNRPLMLIGSVTFAAMILERRLLQTIQLKGGFSLVQLDIKFSTFKEIPGHIFFAAQSFARLMGADFSGQALEGTLSSGPYIFMLRFPFLLVLLFVFLEVAMQVIRQLRVWPNRATEGRPLTCLDQVLWTGLILCTTSSIVTAVIADPGCVRFFLPATVFGAILMARRYPRVPVFALYVTIAFIGSTASEATSIAHAPLRPTIGSTAAWRLVEALEAHDLKHGYGGYWESSITTVLSHGNIKTLALIDDGSHHLYPFRWFTNLDLYREASESWTGRTFFLAQDQPSALTMSQATILATFGKPAETWRIDNQVIDVYNFKPHALTGLAP